MAEVFSKNPGVMAIRLNTRSEGWPLNKIGLASLLVVFGLIAAESARLGVAGLIVELAQVEMDRWNISIRPPPMTEIDRVAGYFSDSLGYMPDNPWALEGLGRLDLARMRASRAPAEALAFARDARKQFREALRQRPTSPFLWANLALSKLYLDEIDAEFFAALRYADELGPWEPSTQQVVLFAGLAAWERLEAEQRESLARVVERGSQRNALKMFEIVKNFRRIDLVCGLSGYHAIAGAECRKTAESAAARIPTARGKD